MLNDWVLSTTETHYIYTMSEQSLDVHSLAIVGNFDIGDVVSGRPCPELLQDQVILLKEFTALLHETVFGTPFPALEFDFCYCVLYNGGIMWEYISSCCRPVSGDARGLNQEDCPCIVWSSTAKRLCRVDSVILKSPSKYMINMNQWGEGVDGGGIKTLADYYLYKYNISVDPSQNVLGSRLGSPIISAPLSAHVKMFPKKNTSSSSVYLIPELVVVHPLTKLQGELSLLARHLFWIESGIISKNILLHLVVPGSNVFTSLGPLFIPRGIRSYPCMSVMLMHVALTCPSAQLMYSYDKLEWLGDSVWRFAASLAGLTDFKIRYHFNVVLSNERMGTVCEKKFSLLPHSSILSNPPSLKSPQTARSRLRNLNILADVIEAVIAVSFIQGGLASVVETIETLGLLAVDDLPSPISGSHSVESFFNSALFTGFNGLQIALKLISEFPNDTVGELTERRRTLLKNLQTNTISYTQMPTCTSAWEMALL